MNEYPVYATVRLYLGPVQAKTADEAKEIAELNFDLGAKLYDIEDVEIEAREP